MLIDPEGKVVATHAGENVFDALDETIGDMVKAFDAEGLIDRSPLPFAHAPAPEPDAPLSYPGKIAIDPTGHTLYIADSNNNRILIVSLPNERAVDVIGQGSGGLRDGSYEDARFNGPQGLAIDGTHLYVADTGNHAIRRIDLRARTVTTIAGNGEQARERDMAGYGSDVSLNSPWDLALHGDVLYIAMAGAHQVWRLDLMTREIGPYAGLGREEIIDGRLPEAAMAQPSGITAGVDALYVADSETSAIRSVSLDPDGEVTTIVGEGLFTFGDADGVGSSVRLQHPLGVLHRDGLLYVADTYNNRIRMLNPVARRVTTIAGSGRRGAKDGIAAEGELNEPSGLAWGNGMLYIADTNNHAIRRYDFATGMLATLRIQGIPKLDPRDRVAGDDPGRTVVIALPVERVAPGEGRIAIRIVPPAGCELNDEAPLVADVTSSGAVEVLRVDVRPSDPDAQIIIHARFGEGGGRVNIAVVGYYCSTGNTALCMIGEERATLPVHVVPGAATDLSVALPLAGEMGRVEPGNRVDVGSR
jgi:sugar lactone lactonase YvrE